MTGMTPISAVVRLPGFGGVIWASWMEGVVAWTAIPGNV